MTTHRRKAKKILRILGPGLVAGASDDDPAGIATYSQAGARYGTGLLWTMPFTFPLMSAVQIMCARLGRTTGHGIAHQLQAHYHPALAWGAVGLLVVANVINIAADVAAMGAAAALILPGPAIAYAAGLTAASFAAIAWLRYRAYARVLRVLVISLFAYVATAFMVDVDWVQALGDSLFPALAWDGGTGSMVVAIFGTTISPYLFFWQSSHEVEQARNRRKAPLKKRPEARQEANERIQWDTLTGMFLSNLVAFFIILTCAVTLHAAGTDDIASAEDAARALRPLAGGFAFILFALGIVGTGLLAIPVLAGSAGFAVAELLGWPHSLEKRLLQAPRFYGLIGAFFLIGWALNLLRINVIDLLVFSAVVNGVVAVPLLVLMIRLTSDRNVMGGLSLPPLLRALVWAAAIVMAGAVCVMAATSLG